MFPIAFQNQKVVLQINVVLDVERKMGGRIAFRQDLDDVRRDADVVAHIVESGFHLGEVGDRVADAGEVIIRRFHVIADDDPIHVGVGEVMKEAEELPGS